MEIMFLANSVKIAAKDIKLFCIASIRVIMASDLLSMPTIHNSRLDEFFPTRKDCVSGSRVCHTEFISTRRHYDEDRAELVMQCMLVMKRPTHERTPSPFSKTER